MTKRKQPSINQFLKQLIERKNILPSKLADNVSVSRATMSRWLSGKDVPSIDSCYRLSKFSGVPILRILNMAGYQGVGEKEMPADQWPEFSEYARVKYPDELDEDLISMIEDLIERRRRKLKIK
jgi:transcriptional regulator with XRE-family HTH domain